MAPMRSPVSRLSRLAVAAAAVVGLTLTAAVAVAPTASAAINHRSPFACGKTFYANNWSPGHSPSGSIDWQSYGGDAIAGENVLATAGGTAYFDNEGSTSYGKWVRIVHSDGTSTRYAHLDTMVRSAGQSMAVSKGTKIGTVGSTGGSSAPHLHYEQRFSGGSVDTSPTVDGVTVPLGSRIAITSNDACGSGANPYTPGEVCGSAFDPIDSAAVTGGRVHLMYNPGTGYNCVVTIKSTNIGRATAVSAFLEVQGGTRTTDSGSYAYYAGPVKKHAPSTCVRWGGSVGSSSYSSAFEHCG